MPGSRVQVVVTGGDLPLDGAFYPAYKTALRELGIVSTPYERLKDRKLLRAGDTVTRYGFSFVHLKSPGTR